MRFDGKFEEFLAQFFGAVELAALVGSANGEDFGEFGGGEEFFEVLGGRISEKIEAQFDEVGTFLFGLVDLSEGFF